MIINFIIELTIANVAKKKTWSFFEQLKLTLVKY